MAAVGGRMFEPEGDERRSGIQERRRARAAAAWDQTQLERNRSRTGLHVIGMGVPSISMVFLRDFHGVPVVRLMSTPLGISMVFLSGYPWCSRLGLAGPLVSPAGGRWRARVASAVGGLRRWGIRCWFCVCHSQHYRYMHAPQPPQARDVERQARAYCQHL